MVKNKLLTLLVLFGHITTYDTLQARIRNQQVQQQAQPQIQQPIQPIVQQPVAQQQPAQQQAQQPARGRRQARRQAPVRRQPRQQVNRRARPRQAQPVQQPIQQPIVVQQPVIVPVVPPVQQPIPTPVQPVRQNVSTAPRLSEFDFGAAGVLPTFVNQNGKRYLILSREALGTDKGTYDDFGGQRDFVGPKNNQKKEVHPVITASREFFEEAILSLSIGFSLQNTKDLIDVENSNTDFVIAHGRNVAYITNFTAYTNTFFDNFYNAFNTTTDPHSKEKDRIAIVGWDELKAVVNNAPFNTGVTIDAKVLNPADLTWSAEIITLRSFFVKKLRPFWMDKPYRQGLNSKIHFY